MATDYWQVCANYIQILYLLYLYWPGIAGAKTFIISVELLLIFIAVIHKNMFASILISIKHISKKYSLLKFRTKIKTCTYKDYLSDSLP